MHRQLLHLPFDAHFRIFVGKTITAARTVDIPRAAYNFRFFSTSMLHHTTDCSPMDHMGCLNYTVRCPVGVGEHLGCLEWNLQMTHLSCACALKWPLVCFLAGLISPWNLPLYLLTWKIAPAIAAGNTVVAKPSEMTSVTAWMLCKLMQQAGRTTGPTVQCHADGVKAKNKKHNTLRYFF